MKSKEMLKLLCSKDKVTYTGNYSYLLPNGETYSGRGISTYLYEPRKTKTKAMKRGINVHELIEKGDRSHIASNAILDWYNSNLTEWKSEVFVGSTVYNRDLIGYIDTIGYNKAGELVIIDNKITQLPEKLHETKTRWFQQLVSYVQHIYNMTGVLADKAIILACNPDTGKLNVVELGVADYSQILMTLKTVLK